MLKVCFAMALSLVSLAGVRAQTADDIINKHFDALGGKDKVAQLKSVVMESSVQLMGNEAPSTISILNNKGYRFEMDMNGLKIVQVFTDKGGWVVSPMGGSTAPQDVPADLWKQGKGQIDIGGPLFNYAAKGNKVEFSGKEDSSYKIKLTTADNVVISFFIDQTTYLLRKTVSEGNMMGQSMEITTTFGNWKKSDAGVFFPYLISLNGGQFSIVTTVNKLQVNSTIDPKIFEKPNS